MIDNFIERYKRLMMGDGKGYPGVTDAPEDYHEANALFLLSTAAGHGYFFMSMPETPIFVKSKDKFGGKRLILWFIIIGKTRITRKTTGALDRAKEIVGDVLKIPIIPDVVTPQFLIKQLSELKQGDTVHACTIIDECSGHFDMLATAEYMSSLDAIMSRLYDGKTLSSGTISRGAEVVPNPYFTVLMASTLSLPEDFTNKMLKQGYLNRFIFVVSDRELRKSLRTQPLNKDEIKETVYLTDVLQAIMNRDLPISMDMNSEAKKLYDEFEIEIEDHIEEENLGLMEGYLGNLPNVVIRIACLHRLGRMTPSEIGALKGLLVVAKEDIEYATRYSEKVWEWFEKVIELKGTRTQAKKVETLEEYEAVVRKAFEEILSNPANVKAFGLDRFEEGEIPQTVLRRWTKIPTKELNELLHAIAEWRKAPSGGGRDVRVWKLS